MKRTPLEAAMIEVTGRVQRVGYRRFVLDLAQESGISGSIENRPEGTAVIFAQGSPAQLSEFAGRLKSPPRPAKVKELQQKKARPRPSLKGFRTVSKDIGEDLHEAFGAVQGEFSDYRREFGAFARQTGSDFKELGGRFDGFAAKTNENFNVLSTKYGEISEKLSQVLAALADEAKRTQEMMTMMRSEANQTAATLNESLRLLREAVERLPKGS